MSHNMTYVNAEFCEANFSVFRSPDSFNNWDGSFGISHPTKSSRKCLEIISIVHLLFNPIVIFLSPSADTEVKCKCSIVPGCKKVSKSNYGTV